jgi:Zn-dependent protease
MSNTINQTKLISIIASFFVIESTQQAGTEDGYRFRCVGQLIDQDTEKGFDDLSSALEKHQYFAAIRPFNGMHELLIFPEIPRRKSPKPLLHIFMFGLTLLSVLLTGGLYAQQSSLPENIGLALWTLVRSGWPFALSLLAILGAHEFGHYFAGKKHGVNVTLPLFIPFPFSTFGTMGAFISMRSFPRNKKQLFDLSVTGPICGLIVSIIVLFIGMRLSELSTIPLSGESAVGMQMEGNSILYLLIKYISFGRLLPQPPGLEGLPLLIFWARFFFTGMPFPWGAQDVMLHPVAWAGWAGLFVTTINLIPAGQLDGGHIFQSVFGVKAMQVIYPIVLALLVTFGFFWAGWWTWAAILFFFGRRQAEPLDQISKLDKNRRLLGAMMIIIFIITFIPVPITIAGF